MLAVMNTVINGVSAYATGDILAPHPTKAGWWKVFGRADDQIMHSTGEKVRSLDYNQDTPAYLSVTD